MARSVQQPDASTAAPSDGLPPSGRVELPSDWDSTLGPNFHGRVLLRRRFGVPGQLDPHERVWLLVDLPGAGAQFRINGHQINASPETQLFHQFDVTDRLQSRNELELEIRRDAVSRSGQQEIGSAEPRRFPDVRLEIRSSHFVDRLSVEVCATESDCKLHLSGRVVGDASDDLALVVTLAGRELAYQQLDANPWFVVTAAADGIPAWLDADARRNPPQLEIRLLQRGNRLWQAARPVLRRRVHWSPANTVLLVDGRPFSLPGAGFPFAGLALRLGALNAEQLLQTAFIFRPDEYDLFDQLGLKLVQHVPAAWAAELVPRLAHHASIVIWSAAATEFESLAARYAPPCAGARPWTSM